MDWKPIKGYEDIYAISDDGTVFSHRTQKFLKPNTDRYGYLYYVFSVNSVRKTIKAHRLVAEAFIPNPADKPTVNHKNGIRTDNRVANLEWATHKEQANDERTYRNILSARANTDFHAMGAKRNFGRKKVRVYKEGHLVGEYGSLKAAANANDTCYSKASMCANGKRQSTGGVQFCYVC